jgi:hypothetical protein
MAKIIEDYERETTPKPAPVRGVESLNFLLKENGPTADDLGSIIGVGRSIAYRNYRDPENQKLLADAIPEYVAAKDHEFEQDRISPPLMEGFAWT